jgi:hypothetical protein
MSDKITQYFVAVALWASKLRKLYREIDTTAAISQAMYQIVSDFVNFMSPFSPVIATLTLRSDVIGFKTNVKSCLDFLEGYTLELSSTIMDYALIMNSLQGKVPTISDAIARSKMSPSVNVAAAGVRMSVFLDKLKLLFPSEMVGYQLSSVENASELIASTAKDFNAWLLEFCPRRNIFGEDDLCGVPLDIMGRQIIDEFEWLASVGNIIGGDVNVVDLDDANATVTQLWTDDSRLLLNLVKANNNETNHHILNLPDTAMGTKIMFGLKVASGGDNYSRLSTGVLAAPVYTDDEDDTEITFYLGYDNAGTPTPVLRNGVTATVFPDAPGSRVVEVVIPQDLVDIGAAPLKKLNQVFLTTTFRNARIEVTPLEITSYSYGLNGPYTELGTDAILLDFIRNTGPEYRRLLFTDASAMRFHNMLYRYQKLKEMDDGASTLIDWFGNRYTNVKRFAEPAFSTSCLTNDLIMTPTWWLDCTPFTYASDDVISQQTAQYMYSAFFDRCIQEAYSMLADGVFASKIAAANYPMTYVSSAF